MTGEMNLDALRQQTFPAPLAPASQGCASALGFHPGTKAMLLLTGTF